MLLAESWKRGPLTARPLPIFTPPTYRTAWNGGRIQRQSNYSYAREGCGSRVCSNSCGQDMETKDKWDSSFFSFVISLAYWHLQWPLCDWQYIEISRRSALGIVSFTLLRIIFQLHMYHFSFFSRSLLLGVVRCFACWVPPFLLELYN